MPEAPAVDANAVIKKLQDRLAEALTSIAVLELQVEALLRVPATPAVAAPQHEQLPLPST